MPSKKTTSAGKAALGTVNATGDAGKMAKKLPTPAELKPKPIVVDAPKLAPARQDFLRATPERTAANLVTALYSLQRETAGAYDIAAIADDGGGYGSRLRVLKALRGGQRVIVKDAESANLRRELYAAVGARTAGDFALKCAALLKAHEKKSAALKKRLAASKIEGEKRRQAAVKISKPIFDGKPILDAPKKMTKDEEAADSMAFRAALAAKVARMEHDVPMSQPRTDIAAAFTCEDACFMVDPANGIKLLCLEKPNSQGAICVYNNGMRVAAGVVALETLETLRSVPSGDLVADVNQLLHPSNGAVVTSTAKGHLTAVLEHCKENIAMATEEKIETAPKKFTAKKTVAKKTVAKKTAKKEAGAPRKSSLFRLLNDAKSTWSAFATQKGEIVAAFVKLGAVGKTAAGVTRAKLIEALPAISDKNISFYLSKWQGEGIVEKLPAAE